MSEFSYDNNYQPSQSSPQLEVPSHLHAHFREFGNSMYKLAIATWAYLAGIIISIISFIGSIVSLFLGGGNSISLMSQFLLILVVGLGIFVFVRLIQYLMKLNTVSTISQDENLLRYYKLTLISEISSIVAPILIWIIIQGSLMNILNSSLGATDPIYFMSSYLTSLLLYIVIIFIIYIVIAVMKILAVIAFEKWANSLRISPNHAQNTLVTKIQRGANNMKVSKIILACTPILLIFYYVGFFAILGGFCLYYIGLGSAGKAIRTYYSNQSAVIPEKTYMSQPQAFQPVYSQPTTSFQTYTKESTMRYPQNDEQTMRYPQNDGQTIKSPNNPNIGKCPSCGVELPENFAQFCAMCGKRLK